MALSLTAQGCAALMTGHNGISLYALNGMVNEGKLSQINDVIKIRRPHIITISKTKTSDNVGKKINTNDYNFFEECQ